jgi:hypothetical protein
MEGVLKSRTQGRTLTAKNPSEARGIRKALRAAGIKFEFKSGKKRKSTKKRNPAKKRTRRKSRGRRGASKRRK